MTERMQRYVDYLNSDEWYALRQRKFSEVGKACQCCPNTTMIRVHHIHYKNLTDCELIDLAVLCEPCHNILHLALKKLRLEPDDAELPEIIKLINQYKETPSFFAREATIKARRRQQHIDNSTRSTFKTQPFISKRDKKILKKLIGRFQSCGYRPEMAKEVRDMLDYFITAKTLRA